MNAWPTGDGSMATSRCVGARLRTPSAGMPSVILSAPRKPKKKRFWREVTELKGRDPLLPAPAAISDAELLQRAWMSLPDKIDSLPVKRAVKVFVFGTNREYEHYCRKQKVRPSGEPEWRKNFLAEFEKCCTLK
mgnify:CR=1 FL=1